MLFKISILFETYFKFVEILIILHGKTKELVTKKIIPKNTLISLKTQVLYFKVLKYETDTEPSFTYS